MMLALLGSICLAAGMLDRTVARTQQEFAAQNYARADEALDAVERYLEYGRWIPWIGGGPLNDVRTRRAAIRYWSGQSDRIVSDRSDPLAAVASDNTDLPLIVANAVYRRGQPQATDRRTALEALQAAASAYLAVLRNAPLNDAGFPPRTPARWGASEVAAYNYEYVVRTREDIDKGTRAPELTDTAEDGPAGRRGAPPPQEPNNRDLKLLIPLEPAEMDKGIEPGKGGRIERKG
jgi:hypothetical protein